MERWLSGRKRTTRNRLMAKTIRGFESHPLRYVLLEIIKIGKINKIAYCPYELNNLYGFAR